MELQKITLIYLEELKYLIKQKTYFFYIQICENYISRFFGNINTKSLNDFIISIKNNYSYSTTKTIKSLINRTLKYAFKVGLIIEPIEITVKLKKTKGKKIESLENFEQLKIEKYILENKKYYHYGILISLYTGIRLGELLSLNWKNINFKNKIINIDKTISTIIYNHKTITIEGSPKTENSIREIPISKQLLIILKELKLNSKSEFVITGRKYNQVQPRAYQKSFENLLNHLKIKHYGFHSLRHTFATRLLEKGVDIKTISELMGHSNPSITLNRYVHTNIKNKRKAVDVL